MEAIKIVSELNRICDTYNCTECPLYMVNEHHHICDNITDFETAIPIIEKWSAEHPFVRNVDHIAEVLEKLGYTINKEDIIDLRCPPQYSDTFGHSLANCDNDCEKCKEWWKEEYKGEE